MSYNNLYSKTIKYDAKLHHFFESCINYRKISSKKTQITTFLGQKQLNYLL